MPARPQLARASWRALGTSATVVVREPTALAPARALVERELDAIDRACSRFRSDSELTRLNAAAGRARPASPLLLDAVAVALRAARITDGDVDPSLGAALELLGYDRDFALLPRVDDAAVASGATRAVAPKAPTGGPSATLRARRVAGWRTIELDRERGTIRCARGVKLDLGATAKALAADRAARAASARIGAGVLVNLGGDIAVAGPAPTSGWPVRVTHDHRVGPEALGQTISIRVGGLATSSTTARRWLHEGRAVHHLLDPGTGMPTGSVWCTVSATAASCVDANIATTAAIVRAAGAPEWLKASGLAARLVARDGTVVCLNNWPAQGPA